MNVPTLLTRLRSMLQNAKTPAPSVPDLNAAPHRTATGCARVVYSNMPSGRQIDGPTAPLPPMQPRYASRRHPDMRARNRQAGPTPARRGSTREAVGL